MGGKGYNVCVTQTSFWLESSTAMGAASLDAILACLVGIAISGELF
jgi:hypothetical protein